jgi:hypothetical protein
MFYIQSIVAINSNPIDRHRGVLIRANEEELTVLTLSVLDPLTHHVI